MKDPLLNGDNSIRFIHESLSGQTLVSAAPQITIRYIPKTDSTSDFFFAAFIQSIKSLSILSIESLFFVISLFIF